MKKMGVSIVGAGDISGKYLENITETFTDIHVIGVYDVVEERARQRQAQYGIPKVYDTLEAALTDAEADIIINLTRPADHYQISKKALEAGKHVYSEKPLAATYAQGKALCELAAEKGLMIGGAPDTFLGAAVQTCRKLIDDGCIGQPIGCAGYYMGRSPVTMHPDPEFYYKAGAGPMHDMGPYYITAFINLLGGISEVFSASKITFPQRIVATKPQLGKVFSVDTYTYIAGTMVFDNGAIGTMFCTHDVHFPVDKRRYIEVYGSDGTLFVPNPDLFGEALYLYRPETEGVLQIPLMFDYAQNSRGLGLADMVNAIANGRPARANGNQMLHVLEVVEGFEVSGKTRSFVKINTPFERQAPMVKAKVIGKLD